MSVGFRLFTMFLYTSYLIQLHAMGTLTIKMTITRIAIAVETLPPEKLVMEHDLTVRRLNLWTTIYLGFP